MRVYAFADDGSVAWRLDVTPEWAQRHDNGALVSLGLQVPGELSLRSLRGLQRKGKAIPVTVSEAAHGGCQSSCKRRGDKACIW